MKRISVKLFTYTQIVGGTGEKKDTYTTQGITLGATQVDTGTKRSTGDDKDVEVSTITIRLNKTPLTSKIVIEDLIGIGANQYTILKIDDVKEFPAFLLVTLGDTK